MGTTALVLGPQGCEVSASIAGAFVDSPNVFKCGLFLHLSRLAQIFVKCLLNIDSDIGGVERELMKAENAKKK